MTTISTPFIFNDGPHAPDCQCPAWTGVDGITRDSILASVMELAWYRRRVELKLLHRAGHVAICEVISMQPGRGRMRQVMSELCAWADCARVTLELTPTDQWGADLQRLTAFYSSLGFVPNTEPRKPFVVQEERIRYPRCKSTAEGELQGRASLPL